MTAAKKKWLVLLAVSSGCIPFDELEQAYRCDAGYEGCVTPPSPDSGTTDAGFGADSGVADAGDQDAGFSCGVGVVECAPNVCVDLENNEAHCGACGRDCLGGGCSGGSCGAVLMQQTLGPITYFRPSLAVSNAELAYNRSDCTIARAPTTPLASASIITHPNCNQVHLLNRVLLEGGDLFWITDQEVGAVLSSGGALARDVTSGSLNRADLVKVGGSLYWTDRAGGTVKRTDANMQGAVFTHDAGLPGEIAAITELGGNLYISNRVQGWLHKVDAQLSTPRQNIARPGVSLQLASCNGAVYAAVQQTDGGLLRFDVNDGGLQRIGGINAPVSAVACDNGAVYWSTLAASSSSIYAARFDGGAPLQLASGFRDVQAVAVDDCCVYWYGTSPSADAGVIHRIRKPW